MLVVEPFPGSDDDIALDALRSRWLRMGQFALGDPVRPVREIAERRGAEFLDGNGEHMLQPPCPDWMRRNHASSEFANLPMGCGTSRGNVRVESVPN